LDFAIAPGSLLKWGREDSFGASGARKSLEWEVLVGFFVSTEDTFSVAGYSKKRG
jgi:hypothetical protein